MKNLEDALKSLAKGRGIDVSDKTLKEQFQILTGIQQPSDAMLESELAAWYVPGGAATEISEESGEETGVTGATGSTNTTDATGVTGATGSTNTTDATGVTGATGTAEPELEPTGATGTEGGETGSNSTVIVNEDAPEEVACTLVDHRNFADAAVQAKLADYYTNYPTEAAQDGTEWPPFTASKFPWLVVNHEFDGETAVEVYYQDNKVFDGWTPSAEVEQEGGTKVARTYIIMSVPEDLGLTTYAETVEGTESVLDAADFKVYLVK